MEVFLKIRHWQLFLLIVGIPLIISLYAGASLTLREEERFVGDAVARLIMTIPFLCYFLWLWSVGKLLNQHLHHQLATPSSNFSISVAVSYFSFFFLLVFNSIYWEHEQEPPQNTVWVYILGSIISLLAITSWFYALNYLAKTLVRAEKESHIKPSEYYGEFVMALIFPVGVWILQPRINTLYRNMVKPT
jgi:hypothetical protein